MWISPLSARAARRLVPVWSVEAGGPAPWLKEKGGHQVNRVLSLVDEGRQRGLQGWGEAL